MAGNPSVIVAGARTPMGKLLGSLGQPEGEARQFTEVPIPIVAGTDLPAPVPVFPKYEEPAEA